MFGIYIILKATKGNNMKPKHLIYFICIVVSSIAISKLYDIGQCTDIGGHWLEGRCFTVLESGGSVGKVRK